jgi:hypothetical protein
LESAVVVAIFSTNCDFDIWVALVSPLIRTAAIIDCPERAQSILHRFVGHFEHPVPAPSGLPG